MMGHGEEREVMRVQEEKYDYSSSENSNTLQNIVSIVTTVGMAVGGIVKFIRRFKK